MSTRPRRVGWLIVGILIGVVVTQTVIATMRTRETVDAMLQAQSYNGEVLRTVRSCTTPGMECYDRAQRQMAKAVASINQITILAASCAAGNVRTAPQIEECVLHRLGRPPAARK